MAGAANPNVAAARPVAAMVANVDFFISSDRWQERNVP
jgi:hypothetical protein